jgi:hypothetical protein
MTSTDKGIFPTPRSIDTSASAVTQYGLAGSSGAYYAYTLGRECRTIINSSSPNTPMRRPGTPARAYCMATSNAALPVRFSTAPQRQVSITQHRFFDDSR